MEGKDVSMMKSENSCGIGGERGRRFGTINELFLERVANFPNDIIYTYKHHGRWVDVTWQQYGEKTRQVAGALLSLGFKKGEKAICLSKNRWEWYYYAMGVVMARGVIVGIYPTTPAQQCKYIIEHSEARFVLLEDQEQLDKLWSIREALPHLEKAIVIKKIEAQAHPFLIDLGQFSKIGAAYCQKNPGRYKKNAAEAKPEEVITLVYTSGTTGPPKGAIISHQHILRLAEMSITAGKVPLKDRCLEFLPLAHIGGQVVGHYFRIYSRNPGIIGEGYNEALYNAWEVAPTTFTSTPRMFEKFYLNIKSRIDDATRFQQWVYQKALSIGLETARRKEKKELIPLWLKTAHQGSDLLVFRKFRNILGGKIKYVISGGAPLSQTITEFFFAIGVPILEAYGMTETTAWVTMSSLSDYRIGSVGRPIPGVKIKIAEDGEILCSSPGNCYGYFKDEGATKGLIDEAGWLHTGDVGTFDKDGFLRITDRKKDIFITAGGKNVAPGNIENLLKTSKYISQAMVYGDKKKYLVALLTLDIEEISKHARDNRILFTDTKELTQQPEIYNLIKAEVSEKNKALASVETIKAFLILREEFNEDRGEITATQKVKRKILTESYREQLEALYK